MKKKTIVALTALFLVVLGFALYFSSNITAKITDYAMNTQITITAKGLGSKKAVEEAVKEVKRLDRLMSVTVKDSDVYKINNTAPYTAVKVSDEVYSLIELALEVSRKTDGAFDITINPLSELWNISGENPIVPSEADIADCLNLVDYKCIELDSKNKTVMLKSDGMSITLGAIAKGYAADRVKDILKDYGIKDGVIDLGGNVYILGKNKTVGIQTPFKKRGEYYKVCKVSDTSVVTSGSYERYFEQDGAFYHHILDPKTGYPATGGFSSCTVICENSALADALSTAAFVAGRNKAQDIAKDYGVHIIGYTMDGKVAEFR